jgi:hypothetical protein
MEQAVLPFELIDYMVTIDMRPKDMLSLAMTCHRFIPEWHDRWRWVHKYRISDVSRSSMLKLQFLWKLGVGIEYPELPFMTDLRSIVNVRLATSEQALRWLLKNNMSRRERDMFREYILYLSECPDKLQDLKWLHSNVSHVFDRKVCECAKSCAKHGGPNMVSDWLDTNC